MKTIIAATVLVFGIAGAAVAQEAPGLNGTGSWTAGQQMTNAPMPVDTMTTSAIANEAPEQANRFRWNPNY